MQWGEDLIHSSEKNDRNKPNKNIQNTNMNKITKIILEGYKYEYLTNRWMYNTPE